MAATRTPPPGLQLSWLDGEALAWQPGRGAYGGNLHHEVARTVRRPARDFTAANRVVSMQVPDPVRGGTTRLDVMCQRLDATALAALGQLDALRSDGTAVSASIAWFGAMYRCAEHLVRHGRVLPVLTPIDDEWWMARWEPVVDDVDQHCRPLLDAMPPVVAAAAEVDPRDIMSVLVDGLCRLTLQQQAWAPSLPDARTPVTKALKAVTKALVAPSGDFLLPVDQRAPLTDIGDALQAVAARADGQPLVAARLRLGLPGEVTVLDDTPDHHDDEFHRTDADLDPLDDEGWPLALEVVDVDDRSRWCSMGELERLEPTALAIAGDQRFLSLLQRAADDGARAISTVVPLLAPWTRRGRGPITVEQASALLEAVEELGRHGIEVIAPEQLTRRRTTARATATPRDDHEGSGRFGASALLDWSVVVDDTPVPDEVLQRAAEQGANLIDVGGRWVQIDRAEARRALANIEERRRQQGEVGALELLALAAELARELEAAGVETNDDDVLRGTGWAAQLLAGLPDREVQEGTEPPGFTATLRPYQRRGLGWLQFLHGVGLGGCLADDMGLGKTPTTLAHLAGIPGPHLVVCPLSVVRNWQTETERFAPMLRVLVHHGTGRLDGDELVAAAAGHDVIITTYQVAARDLDAMLRVEWSVLVIDEAQAVKNPDTKAARAMRALHARQKVALTGTPVENRLSELWSIMHVVAPGLLGSATQFRHRFSLPIESRHDEQATQRLRQLTAPFLLRRTKADRSLVPDLPDKIEQVAWAPLTREQAHMYQGAVEQLMKDAQEATGMQRRGLVLKSLTRLKQICNHPAHALGDGSRLEGRSGKLHRFDELVTDLLDAGEQALVFTQFVEMGMLLQRHLRERFHQQVPFLHGSVSRAGRDAMVHDFQQGTAASPLLIVSLRAGGVGLNLTAASQVVHYDRWWNPAVEDQATDRAWRIGQQRTVFVHKLVSEGTVEERIDTLITAKKSLADTVVGSTGEDWLTELSTDDLRDLVHLDHSRARGV